MIFLILSIVFSTLTVSFFKLFERYGVNTLNAIVVNYISCAILGSIFIQKNVFTTASVSEPWFVYSLILGFLFISIFNAIAKTAQTMGVSISMVAAKLSVVLPIIIAVFIFNEVLSVFQLIGILLSLLAVWLISDQPKQEGHLLKHRFALPLIVFVGSGLIDTLLKYLQRTFIPAVSEAQIVTTIFANAFLFGLLLVVFNSFKSKNHNFSVKDLLWGIALGVPNYFSMYFLVKTLSAFNEEASVIFPVNNIGIVAVSTLVGVGFFKEKLSKQNQYGLVVAAIAIALISLL